MGGDGSWTDRDRTLTLALTLYEAGLCGECGQPMSICRDPEREFEIHEDTCQAKAVIDRHRAENAKKDPEPGVIISARLDADTGDGYAVNPFTGSG